MCTSVFLKGNVQWGKDLYNSFLLWGFYICSMDLLSNQLTGLFCTIFCISLLTMALVCIWPLWELLKQGSSLLFLDSLGNWGAYMKDTTCTKQGSFFNDLLIMIFYLFDFFQFEITFICLPCLWMCVHLLHGTCGRLENNFGKWVLSFHHVGSQDQTQNQARHTVSLLAGPSHSWAMIFFIYTFICLFSK